MTSYDTTLSINGDETDGSSTRPMYFFRLGPHVLAVHVLQDLSRVRRRVRPGPCRSFQESINHDRGAPPALVWLLLTCIHLRSKSADAGGAKARPWPGRDCLDAPGTAVCGGAVRTPEE